MQDHGPVGGNIKDYAVDRVLRRDTLKPPTIPGKQVGLRRHTTSEMVLSGQEVA
jgi:hypothetical protein